MLRTYLKGYKFNMKSHINNGTRYCPICGKKLVRNGHYSNGKIRLYCKQCCKSYSFNLKSRKTLRIEKWISRYTKYIVGKQTISELGYAKTTFWNNTRNIKLNDVQCYDPPPNLNCIGLDGTWTGNACYLIANSRSIGSKKDYPLATMKVCYEKFDTWAPFISKLPQPRFVVCDGQKGMIKAIKLLWPNTNIQICLFHVWQMIRRNLTLNPKTEPGKELLQIGRFLISKVKDSKNFSASELAELWTNWLEDWYERNKDFINEKTYSISGTWFRTHKNLWSTYRSLKKYLDSGMLFAFTKGPNIPRTNNGLEGGLNSQLKGLMWMHRGASYQTRNNIIMLYLNSRSKPNTKINC